MEYFEEFAELIESEEKISYEDIYAAVKDSIPEDLGEIVENYFEESLNGVPDEEQQIYMLIENIKSGLLFLCENLEDDATLSQFTEEVERFRNWYTDEDLVVVDGKHCCIAEAIATARANKITGETSVFDFTGALDYELNDFNFSIGSFKKIDIVGDDDEDLENSETNNIN
ncbi:MAG: hypothetical protein Q4F55_01530 [Bacillota bacterium]|nr:hypothetical protein [Bacillota bacterium]